MSDTHKKELEKQLWNIADALRSKMNADEYRNYILGFIFFKYLSERMRDFANKQLERAPIKSYTDIPEGTEEGEKYIETMRKKSLKPSAIFSNPPNCLAPL
jgi:type I restriction enzyme M protein